jgi:hypothetical protein
MSLGVSASKEGVAASGDVSQPNPGEDGCMNKRTIFFALSLMTFGFSLAHGATMSLREFNIDRPGGDYTSFFLPTQDPTLCENACANDPSCKAWNYDTGAGVLCFLKNSVPNPTKHLGVVGGVKRCATMSSPMEFNTDRSGFDYRFFDLPIPDPILCENTCASEAGCKAWNYDHGGGGERCFMKDRVPAASESLGLVSGFQLSSQCH